MFGGIIFLILGLSTIAFGIYTRKNPTFGWRMNEGWKVKGDSEPSVSYIDSIKFTGIIAISVGALMIIFGILMLL
ncbi:hypothetical protein GCM10010912_24940 [Paenibacillus albidus]|uniref:DUF6199 domain-containing protein n=1 Tax=Paenibacillus albidus TaxID=2041023 RepID=A0A917C9C7_9BACL|nr:DUF6199 family natural product biosynthesis protein [Paenibacillus albidus]GGF78893.1 hypothetical protein GCM10010912_24940 [Paenibacillus albidus]